MFKLIAFCARCVLVAFLTVACLAISSSAQTEGGPAAPSKLRCEYLSDPLGVDTTQPRLFWVLGHSQRDEKQSAYQVLVATTADALAHDQGDRWDSGKVASEEFTQVVYSGKALESGKTYYWKVRAWDKEGRRAAIASPRSSVWVC